MAPYFPLGYLSEQNTAAFVIFFAGGNFHARSPNSLVLPSLRKMRDYCHLVGDGCLTSQKDVRVGDNTAWYELNSTVFCVG